MNRYRKYTAFFLSFLALAVVLMPAGQIAGGEFYTVSAYAGETSTSDDGNTSASGDSSDTSEETDVAADPVLFVDGLTVYIDVETDGQWSTLEGTLSFDPSLEVADYGTVQDIVDAAAEQSKLSMPVSNVTDEGEFIFAGIFTNIMDEADGITYTGHVFFITFEELSEPITVTLEDSGGNVVEERTVDGEISDVDETGNGDADDGTSANSTSSDNDADTDGTGSSDVSSDDSDAASGNGSTVNKAGSSFHKTAVILRIVCVALAVILVLVIVLLIVCHRKNRKKKHGDSK